MAVVDVAFREGAQVSDQMTDFERVFRDYAPSINYFFARRGFPEEECRDLTQETFLRAFRGKKGFRGDAQVETWLRRIAANVWKNRLRSMKASKRDAPTVSIEDATEQGEPILRAVSDPRGGAPKGPQARLLEAERGRMLREAVKDLPPRMRQCVTLRIDRGLKYREIATILHISIDTVKTQLYQARHRLKDELQDYFALDEPEG